MVNKNALEKNPKRFSFVIFILAEQPLGWVVFDILKVS